jgi:N-acetylglutamate synthase
VVESAGILELERAAAAHWRGTEEEWLGDWLLRAAAGFTGRANSVLPLGDPGVPRDQALAHVVDWYRARGLPPMIAVPLPLSAAHPGEDLDNHLAQRLWLTRPGPAFVMVADLPLGVSAADPPAAGQVVVSREPDPAWAARYHYRGQDHLPPAARTVLTSAPSQAFVSIRNSGEVLAIARLSIADGWAGLTAVEVRQDRRRQGLGTAVTMAACGEAATAGLNRIFLQTEIDNAPARALYEALGFTYSHRYHYRVAPQSSR